MPADWSLPLPGGVMDGQQQLALWRSPDGAVRALDLHDGTLLWASDPALPPLLPLLPGAAIALVLALRPARVLGLRMRAPGAGGLAWTSRPLPWPAWAADAPAAGAGWQLRAAWLDDQALLHWHLAWRAEGGAPPRADDDPPAPCVGAWRIDGATGEAADMAGAETFAPPVGSGRAAADDDADPAPQLAALLPAGLGALAGHAATRSRAYALLYGAQDGLQHSALAAVDRAAGRVMWRTVVDERPVQRPPPQRP